MGFKNLFKVRQPGNGDAVQKSFARAAKSNKGETMPTENNSQPSGGKKSV